MMKKIMFYLLIILLGTFSCLADLSRYPETADGVLSDGEYASGPTLEGYEQLMIAGGGANTIDMYNQSYLEIQYTSKPLTYTTGLDFVGAGHNANILCLDGYIGALAVGGNATLTIKGGHFYYGIEVARAPHGTCHATIYCQSGYEITSTGITGLWEDDTEFYIHFINAGYPYPPTVDYVNVVEVMPEPLSIVLLGFGMLFGQKRR